MSNLQNNDIPWVLVRVQDAFFALESSNVVALSLLEEKITPSPDSDEVRVGMVHFRGKALSLIDLRGILGMPSVEAELEELKSMLNARKSDHINWESELKRCVCDHTEFRLATDPHKCALGKWLDNYQPKSQSVAFQLKAIRKPHKMLHESAVRVINTSNKGAEDEAKAILANETAYYKSQILNLLDQTKEIFEESTHKMLVVISNENTSCGLLVDEVVAVEQLDFLVSENTLPRNTNLVSFVAERKDTQELVLVLNIESLWSYVQKSLSPVNALHTE